MKHRKSPSCHRVWQLVPIRLMRILFSRSRASLLWILFFIGSLVFGISSHAQIYRPGDWVSYNDFRNVTSIALDQKTVYFGTTGGVLRYDRMKDRWDDPQNETSGLNGSSVQLVAIDPITSEPWTLTENSLSYYNPLSFRFTHFTSMGDLTPREVQSIGMNPDGVWIGGGSKKAKLDRRFWVWESVSEFPEDIEWFEIRNSKFQTDPQNRFLAPFTVKDEKYREYPITALRRDGRDLWVGTWGYGIFRYSPVTYMGEHIPFGLAQSDVETMTMDGETLLFGGAGLTLWNKKEGRWEHLDPDLFSQGVTSLLFDPVLKNSSSNPSDRRIWVGTPDGLIRYKKEYRVWKRFTKFHGLPHNNVTVLTLDGDEIWIGTRRGLGNLSLSGDRILSIKELKNLEILDIYVQPPLEDDSLQSYIWVATSRGVFILNRKEGKWGELDDPEGTTGFGTTAIERDGNLIWFGTRLGVMVYDLIEEVWNRSTSSSSRTYLPNREINDLEVDEENLWVGTNDGVARYRKKEETWQIYTTFDGLISNVVNAILIDGDYVFFATPKGVTRYYWKGTY